MLNMRKERIDFKDSVMEAVLKIAEGNPGALRVCMELYQHTGNIDPDSAFGGLGSILALDSLGIYGSKIWMLYKDVCKEDLVSMVIVLRSEQLGFITENQIAHAIENYGSGLDIEDLYKKVTGQLTKFNTSGKIEE